MRVATLVRDRPRVCSPGNSLATAGRILAEADCSLLAVLDSSDQVVGVITERDICIEVAQRERRASQIRVSEVVRDQIYSCSPDDELCDALEMMSSGGVRRLLVLSEDGSVNGILSLDDIILNTWLVPAAEILALKFAVLNALNTLIEDNRN